MIAVTIVTITSRAAYYGKIWKGPQRSKSPKEQNRAALSTILQMSPLAVSASDDRNGDRAGLPSASEDAVDGAAVI
jgi:hypothetical protein